MSRRAVESHSERAQTPIRTRGDRLGFRVDHKTKTLIERAAEIERRSLTDFCMTTLAEAAQRIIERHEVLALSERDRTAFFDVLIRPPKPNARLRKAFRTYRLRLAP